MFSCLMIVGLMVGRIADGARVLAGGFTTSGTADDDEFVGTHGRLFDVLRGALYWQATLSDGTASVSDACFTGSDNIVMCTDTTAANPVRCTPASAACLSPAA